MLPVKTKLCRTCNVTDLRLVELRGNNKSPWVNQNGIIDLKVNFQASTEAIVTLQTCLN